jgi:hypothetical protein
VGKILRGKSDRKFHIQKALGKKPGQAKFLTGHGKPQIKPARGPKGTVRKTKGRKLNTGRGKWF